MQYIVCWFLNDRSDKKLEIQARLKDNTVGYESSVNSSIVDDSSAYEPSYSYSQQSGISTVSDSSQNSNHINGMHGGLGKISETEGMLCAYMCGVYVQIYCV